MLKNSSPKIALWIALGLLFTAGAVSLLVVAAASGSDEPPDSGHASTSWYTTQPPPYTGDPGTTEGPTQEPTEPSEPSEPSEPQTPVTVVTQTIVAVNPGGGGGDGSGSLIAAFGSLLSGAAAVGTLLHAVHLSRQHRNATARDDGATPAPSPQAPPS